MVFTSFKQRKPNKISSFQAMSAWIMEKEIRCNHDERRLKS